MTIKDLWDTWYDWHSKLEVCVYKGDAMLHKGTYLSMSDEVKNAKVYRFVMAGYCLVIFITENEDE